MKKKPIVKKKPYRIPPEVKAGIKTGLIACAIVLIIGAVYHRYLSSKRSTDIEITVPSQGVIWATPNGSKYKVTMLDDGTFNKEEVK